MKTVDAIRGIERWGTGEMMKTAFAGFKALPEQTTATAWYEVLEVTPKANADQLKKAYRKKAMETHPDRAGNSEKFNLIQTAYQQGLSAVGKSR